MHNFPFSLRIVFSFLLFFSIQLQTVAINYPSIQQPGCATFETQNDNWTLKNNLLTATFIKQGNKLIFGGVAEMNLIKGTELFEIHLGNGTKIMSSEMICKSLEAENLEANSQALKRSLQVAGKAVKAAFEYKSLTVLWRAILRDSSHYLRFELSVYSKENIQLQSITPLQFTVKNIAGNTTPTIVGNTRGSVIASNCLFAAVETPMATLSQNNISLASFVEAKSPNITPNTKLYDVNKSETNTNAENYTSISGKWNRNTILAIGDTFHVSSVVGMIADGQRRRSFLAYLERERAVPWRSFIIYNSWYELNINRNDDKDPRKRMNEAQCLSVLDSWKSNLFTKHKTNIDAFVWDDGWDNFNSLWDFHVGFPNGFSSVNAKAKEQNCGIGTWLSPVGGYGASKKNRLAFWNGTHGTRLKNFQLSNKEYFDAFVSSCSQMVSNYNMRYFKFDGISDFFSAVGPKNDEDAECIINVINVLRKQQPDLFINSTVGTWASPFWLRYSDAVWWQEGDFGTIGNQGNKREKWITYRDRLVYQNFVQNAPFSPINSIMTHGLIVTKYGPPSEMPHDNSKATFDGIVKEMRCAFACGTNMVELYLDSDLMSNIGEDGALWAALADCIAWHRSNADVLADSHWVGGNPWDGKHANVYGWAAWNEQKSTLTLRNPSGMNKLFSTTLRQALEIPNHINGKIVLKSAFNNQTNYADIIGKEIDIDALINFNMPPFDVIVLNGVSLAN